MRTRRRLVRFLLSVVLGFVAVVIVGLLVLQTDWARRSLGSLAASQAERFIQGDVSIGRLGGNLLTRAIAEDVVVRRKGVQVLSAARIDARYDLRTLLSGRLAVPSIRIERPVVDVTAGPDGGAAFAGLFTGGAQPAQGGGAFTVDEVVVRDGLVVVGPKPAEMGGFRVPDRLESLDARLAVTRPAHGVRIRIAELSFRGVSPAVTVQSVAGAIVIGRRDLHIDALAVQMAGSAFEIDGTIENYARLGDS